MGILNVDAMLESMSPQQLLEWRLYADLEPFPGERADYYMKQLAQVTVNVQRSKKQRYMKLEEFTIIFDGEGRKGEKTDTREDGSLKPKKTEAEMKAITFMLAAIFPEQKKSA